MKRVWLYASVAVALAGITSVAVSFANPLRRGGEDVVEADAMPPYEVLAMIRGLGFDPITQPARRGNYYVLHAYDARGVEMRVVADIQFGDVVSVTPARAVNPVYAPQYSAGPRIIQVPDNYYRGGGGNIDVPQQPPRRSSAPAKSYGRSTVNTPEIDTPKESNAAPAEETRQPQQQLPPLRNRRVLTAPVRPDGGLSPVYPTGRWRSRVEEFGQPPAKRPANATTNVDVNTTGPENPPVGYTPPKVKGTIRMIEPARPGEPAKGSEPTLSKDETPQPATQSAEPAQASAEPVVQKIEPAAQDAEPVAQDTQPAAQGEDQPPQGETRD